jgi:hypothetical protein
MSFTHRGADGRLYTLSAGSRVDSTVTQQGTSAAKSLARSGYKGADHVAGDYHYGPLFAL